MPLKKSGILQRWTTLLEVASIYNRSNIAGLIDCPGILFKVFSGCNNLEIFIVIVRGFVAVILLVGFD